MERDGNPIPQLLENAAIETFNQTESSCLGCHSFARPVNKFQTSDFSWIMSQANWPDRKLPARANGRQLFAYMNQDVLYVPTKTAPPGGPFHLTWDSFPDSKWNTYNGFMKGENPHGASTRIYLNDIASKFVSQYKDDADLPPTKPFPEGSIILMENHRSWFPGNLVLLTIRFFVPREDFLATEKTPHPHPSPDHRSGGARRGAGTRDASLFSSVPISVICGSKFFAWVAGLPRWGIHGDVEA